MNRAIPLAIVLLGATLSLTPGAAAADLGAELEEAWWGATPSEVDPGEHGRTLTVQFRNIDSVAFYAVEATLRDHPNLTASFEGAKRDHLGEQFDSGDVWRASFTVDLDEALQVGTSIEVVINLDMRAAETKGSWTEGEYSYTSHEVTVPIPGRTDLDLPVPEGSIPAESTVQLALPLTNQGTGRAGTLEVALAPTSDSGLHVKAPQAPVRIDRLASGDAHTVEATLLTPTDRGVHELEATVSYVNTVGTTETRTFTLPLTVAYRGQDPLETRLLNPVATAGRVNDLRFSMTNTGDAPQGDVEVTVTPRATSVSSSGSTSSAATLNGTGTVTLGRLAGQEARAFTVPLFVSRSAPDLVSLDVQVTWTDTGGFARSLERTFALVVEGAIDLQVTGLTGRVDALAGQAIVQGTITNTGNVEATNVYVRLLPAPGLTGTNPLYQGDLDPDAPIPFSLTSPANATEVPENATLVLTWTDDMGQARELTRTVALVDAPGSAVPDTSSSGDNGPRSTPGPGAAVGFTALVLGALEAARARRWEA